jgi:hypothetical protein
VDEQGTNEHPVAFFSQKFSQTQCKWSTIEREAYAIVASLKFYHHLIYCAPIVIYSDHNPLCYIVDNATKSAKLTRWALALQEYDIDFRFLKGVRNSVDSLSRLI